jgi:hypothetical protein
LQDILKFGVDKLLNDEGEEEEVDFTSMLGPTVDGEWQAVEDKSQEAEEEKEEDMDAEVSFTFFFSFCLFVYLFCLFVY